MNVDNGFSTYSIAIAPFLAAVGTLFSVHIDRTRLVRHEALVAYVESLPMAG